MSFVKEIFKPKPKAPRELVSVTLQLLEQLKTRMEGKAMEKTVEDISKHLLSMKGILFGDGESEPDAEQVQALGLEIESSNLIVPLLASISQLEFEARKDVVLLLSHMLRRHCPSTCTVLLASFDIITDMIVRYDSKEAALNFGSVLRECIRVPALAQRLLQTRAWSRLLPHVESCRFDVSTDSFLTLKELLTKHKTAVAEHLERNFDDFFSEYRNLLLSQNYVARRQLLRLLGELLGDRCNFKIMTRLIADVDLLKVRPLLVSPARCSPSSLTPCCPQVVMNALRDRSRSIQFEAFHIFKIFVANPNKHPEVTRLFPPRHRCATAPHTPAAGARHPQPQPRASAGVHVKIPPG